MLRMPIGAWKAILESDEGERIGEERLILILRRDTDLKMARSGCFSRGTVRDVTWIGKAASYGAQRSAVGVLHAGGGSQRFI